MNSRIGTALVLFSLTLIALLPGTAEAQGVVSEGKIHSKLLKRSVTYRVYVPEGYEASIESFPIMYLLHGHGGSEKDWFSEKSGNLQPLLDSLISHKNIPPMVAVSLDAGNSWYVDSLEPMESFYLKEFVPHIENAYRIDKKMVRTIAGNSAGGFGALRFSLLNPGLFDWVVLLSPAAYEPLPPMNSSARKVKAFAENGHFSESKWHSYSYRHRWNSLQNSPRKPSYFISTGDDDAYNIVPVVVALQQKLLLEKVPCELRVVDGGHSWRVWRNQIAEALVLIFSPDLKSH